PLALGYCQSCRHDKTARVNAATRVRVVKLGAMRQRTVDERRLARRDSLARTNQRRLTTARLFSHESEKREGEVQLATEQANAERIHKAELEVVQHRRGNVFVTQGACEGGDVTSGGHGQSGIRWYNPSLERWMRCIDWLRVRLSPPVW